MIYEMWQLFGRLSTILALQQYPEEAPSAVTVSADELAAWRKAVEEEIELMKAQTCARTCADGRTYSTIAGVYVAGRFPRKIGFKHRDIHYVKLEYGLPDSSRDLFTSLTPFETILPPTPTPPSPSSKPTGKRTSGQGAKSIASWETHSCS